MEVVYDRAIHGHSARCFIGMAAAIAVVTNSAVEVGRHDAVAAAA